MSLNGRGGGGGSQESPFKLGPKVTSRPSDPESVFADLRPRDEAVRHLWSHQADILREYHKTHVESSDVALELPTGMGKTLVGLLLAEYRRRALGDRVAYLCPTRQLAKQVASQAVSYGLDVSLLVGPQKRYPQHDFARYASGDAVAITTYSAVFNANPRLRDAHVLILDDAHAGGDFVADLWSLFLNRDLPVYRQVTELYADMIPRPLLMRLLSNDIDPRDRLDVYKLPSDAASSRHGALIDLLDARLTGDPVYRWRMVRDHLIATHLYVSWSGILVRPLIPPTLRHQAFANARHRVYMSATLGAGGELERLIGVDAIRRIPVPENWESQRTGRRFILFPNFSLESDEVDDLVKRVVRERDRTLLICPTRIQADDLVRRLREADAASVLDSTAVEDTLAPFSEHKHAALVLAGRYDGIDLPDSSCRNLVLLGLPSALNLQERFYTDKLRADAVLRDRIRTRITQGVGRCTRNPRDYAAVLLCGTDLLDFCLRRENRQGMPRELQAEVQFGLDNSQADSVDSILERLAVFFDQDDRWAPADAWIREKSRQCSQQPDSVGDQLMNVAQREVRYSYALWDGDLRQSLQLAREIADQLSGDELRNYRAWWFYLASSAASMCARSGAGGKFMPVARELMDRARAAAAVGWIRGIEVGAAGARVFDEDHLTVLAAENVARRLQELGFAGPRFEVQMSLLKTQLSARDHNAFHAGLALLGDLLGFMTSRPDGTGSPDVIWRLEPEVAVVWEAKSQAGDGEAVSLSTARQCVGHASAAKELLQVHEGEECYVVVACHRAQTTPAAIPQIGDTRLFSIASVLKLAESVTNALRRSRARAAEASDVVAVVREDLAAAGLEPRLVVRHLTATRAREAPET